MNKLVKNNVYWIGNIDWELKKFHGEDFSLNNGSSQNSYLIKEEKIVLIDTVWLPHSTNFINNLKKEIDLNKIDYIIINHSEIDHSGSLPDLMKEIPNTPIYCTAKSVESLEGQYGKNNWNFHIVKNGDSLDIGNNKKLIFIQMTMLHWPDSMATYLTGDNILFSNDAFGQHYATDVLFNDLSDQNVLMNEALKYYVNILNPYGMLVKNKINELKKLNLPIDIIAPSHGIIWRNNPTQIIDLYDKWSSDYKENQITIVYETMWNGTKKIAEEIEKYIKVKYPNIIVKLFNIGITDKTDITVEIFKSKTIIVGAPTVYNDIPSTMTGFLSFLKQLKFKNKKAMAFGCYGWSGEGCKIINEKLQQAGFTVSTNFIKSLWNPNKDVFDQIPNLIDELVK